MILVAAQRVNVDVEASADQSRRSLPLLALPPTVVFHEDGSFPVEVLGDREVDAVLGEIEPALPLVPRGHFSVVT